MDCVRTCEIEPPCGKTGDHQRGDDEGTREPDRKQHARAHLRAAPHTPSRHRPTVNPDIGAVALAQDEADEQDQDERGRRGQCRHRDPGASGRTRL